MSKVDVCPKNLTERQNASRRLRCGFDEYGNNQYVCLPNKEKSSFIEMCYNGLIGLFEKGNCPEIFNGELIKHNCTDFQFGCPDKPFRSNEVYKYSACQAINFKHHCYRLDPTCPPDPTVRDDYVIATGILGGIIIIFLIIVTVCFVRKIWQRGTRKKGTIQDVEASSEELQGLVNKDQDEKQTENGELENTKGNKLDAEVKLMTIDESEECARNQRQRQETDIIIESYLKPDPATQADEQNDNTFNLNDRNQITVPKRQRHDTDTSIESYLKQDPATQADEQDDNTVNLNDLKQITVPKRRRNDTETSIESYLQEKNDENEYAAHSEKTRL